MPVHEKLNTARALFHALKLEKTGHNTFAKYKYFELGDFLIPALNVFREVGLCAVVSFPDKATMTIIDVAAPQDAERIVIESPMGSAALKGCHEVQNIGAVETYQRRYLWVAALEIVEHDALDSSEPVKPSKAADRPTALAATLQASIDAAKAAKQPAGVMGAVLSELPELSAEHAKWYEEQAYDASRIFASDGQAAAFDFVKQLALDNEQTMYLWNQMDSKLRSALKVEKGLRIGSA